jgi:hypothetical protein
MYLDFKSARYASKIVTVPEPSSSAPGAGKKGFSWLMLSQWAPRIVIGSDPAELFGAIRIIYTTGNEVQPKSIHICNAQQKPVSTCDRRVRQKSKSSAPESRVPQYSFEFSGAAILNSPCRTRCYNTEFERKRSIPS